MDFQDPRFFHHVFMVAPYANSNVKRLFQCNSRRSARGAKFSARIREPKGKILTAFSDPWALGCGNVGLNFVRGRAFLFAILQRCQAAAMESHVRIRRLHVQAWADHQYCLTVFVHSFAKKRNVRCQRDVTRHFLPRKLEGVFAKPHILAAAGNRVASGCRVEFRRTWMQHTANIAATFKYTDWRGGHRARLLCPRAILRRECQHRYGSQSSHLDHFVSAHDEILHSPDRRATLGCSISIVNSSALRASRLEWL